MKILPSFEFPDQKREYVDNIQVKYYETGKGIPLVLLHGWPQTSLIWRKIIPTLQKEYRIIAVELPGMGNNNAAKSADTLTVALFLKTFLDQINIDHFHFVAHDIGAWVAVTFALEFEQSLKTLSVLDAGIPGLIPDEIFSPVNAKKIWQFYFHAIDDIPEFLLAGKEAEYLNWYFNNKTFVKDALSDEVISHYIQCYTGKENLKYGFEYYRAFNESAGQNLAYNAKLIIPVLAIGAEYGQGLNMDIAMQKVSEHPVQCISIENSVRIVDLIINRGYSGILFYLSYT